MNDVRWDEAAKLLDTEPRKAVELAEQIDREDTPAEKQRDIRRAHQCRHDGCDSPALYEVYLHLRYGLHLVAIETLRSTLCVCDKHKKHAERFITSDHNKRSISAELAKIGRLGIDWDNAVVEFVPFGELSLADPRMVPMGVA